MPLLWKNLMPLSSVLRIEEADISEILAPTYCIYMASHPRRP
jgi:hypothetical protein